MRLLQVRQQQKLFAKKLRDDVKRRKEEEKSLLENHLTVRSIRVFQLLILHLKAQHRAFCEDELDKLQEKCQKQLKMVGCGHICAQDQNLVNTTSYHGGV